MSVGVTVFPCCVRRRWCGSHSPVGPSRATPPEVVHRHPNGCAAQSGGVARPGQMRARGEPGGGHDDPSLDYGDLLARLADVVYAVDVDGRFTYINPAGERIFGWDLRDLIGRHFSAVIDPAALPETAEHFRLGMQSAEPGRYFETRILQPDGQARDLEIHAGNIYRDGRLVGRQGVGRDITELRRLQENLA